MARHKDQAARREQLVAATAQVIAERGLVGLRAKDVATAAGISPRLVAYYYPDLDSLVDEVYRAAVERYYWQRLHAIEHLDAPEERLRSLMESGLPRSRDEQVSRVLYELSVDAGRSRRHAVLMTLLFDREVSLYLTVLEAGAASGAFLLTEPAMTVARNFVALEDALGLHILGHNSSVDVPTALAQLHSYARTATDVPLDETNTAPRTG